MKAGATPRNPFRKRSFNLPRDVALMWHCFEDEHPGMKTCFTFADALRQYFTEKGYAKKLSKLEKAFPAKD